MHLCVARLSANIALAAGLVSAVAGCAREPQFQAMTEAEISAAAPLLTLSAQELQERFRATPAATSLALVGKVVEVKGQVELVGVLETGEPYVMISGGPKGSRPTQCLVADKYPWRRVAPGLSVAIKGQVLNLDSKAIPTLAQAVIVSVDESQAAALRYSADELCRQFADDPAAAEKRYSETWGWVAGTIESLDNVNGMLYLDGPGNAQVGCGTVSEEKVWDSSLKPGMSVVIMGQLMKGSRRGLAVRNCLPPEVRGDAHAGVAPREEAESGQPVTAP